MQGRGVWGKISSRILGVCSAKAETGGESKRELRGWGVQCPGLPCLRDGYQTQS